MTATKKPDSDLDINALLDKLTRELEASRKENKHEAVQALDEMKAFEIQSLCHVLFAEKHIERRLFINNNKRQLFRIVLLHGKPLFGILSDCKGKSTDKHFTVHMECLTKTALDIQIDALESEGFTQASYDSD